MLLTLTKYWFPFFTTHYETNFVSLISQKFSENLHYVF